MITPRLSRIQLSSALDMLCHGIRECRIRPAYLPCIQHGSSNNPMKSFLYIAAVMLLHAAPALAQGNWPYHAAGSAGDGNCDCQCYRLGLELGTTVLSSWSQAETFT